MHKSLLTILSLFLCLTGCKGEENTPTPTPDPVGNLKKADTTVVYECNERLFAKQNAFRAIEAYLPVLQEMQVNVLWLMPVHPRGTVKTVNSPYCVKDYYAIDPAFGTLADLQSLVNACHQRGIRVILDWVANHTAWDNQWYLDHPELYTAPVDDEKNWNDVVPLDYNKPAATFWQTAIAAIRNIKPAAIMLAETHNVSYFDAGFDWLYSWDYLSGIQSLYQKQKVTSTIYTISNKEMSSTPAGKSRLRYTTTHDASSENAPATFYTDAQGQLSAACLTFFLEGIPMIYSSQEIGNMEKINFFNYNILSFEDNAARQAYIALMKAYTATAEARYGTIIDYSTDHVAMFSRSQESKEILVIVNTTNAEQEITLPMRWQRNKYTNAITGEQIYSPKSQSLQPYEYIIYSK